MFFSCNKSPNFNIDVENIPSNAKIIAFNDVFYNKNLDLLSIKTKYPILFDDTENEIWEGRRNDSVEIAIQKQVKGVYKNYNELEFKLNDLFKHIKYYYPRFQEPTIYLYSSKLEDYSDPITYINDERGNYLFLSIDCFLGEKNKFYESFPAYIKKRMTPNGILAGISEKITEKIIPRNIKSSNFLSAILFQGKKMILADAFLPNLSDEEKIGYTKKEMEWCKKNEKEVWTYFIDGNYFFNPDPKLVQRFIDLAPFSKFYAEIDAESPGSIGTWLGWQIARAYLEENQISVQEFISLTDENSILKNSDYNP